MQHSIIECCISEKQQARKAEQSKENHLRIMIDAPREVNIVRSTVLENQITDPEERAKLPKYYAEEEHPEKYRKKSNVIITKGNADK